MDLLSNLALGFQTAVSPATLLYCFIGVFVGTLIGVLPGIGPVTAMALLLPVTLSAPPEAGIIMMAAHNQLFLPAVLQAKQMLINGDLGKVHAIHSVLESRLLSGLITDERTARALVNLEPS